MEAAAGQGRRRRIASLALAVLGALLVLLGGVLLYASRTVFDSEQFAERAVATLHDERVRTPLAEAMVDELIARGERDLINARPVLVGVVEAALDSKPMRSVLRGAAERMYRMVFTRERDRVILDLADATSVVLGAIRAISPQLAGEIPERLEPRLESLLASDFAVRQVKAAEDVEEAAGILPLLGLLALAASVWLHRDRRLGLRNVGLALSGAAVIGVAGLAATHALILARLGERDGEIAAAVWDAYLADLTTVLLVGLAAAAVFTAAVSARLRVGSLESLRQAAAIATRRPTTGVLRILRALVLLAIGLAIVLSPHAFVRLLAVVVGAAAIFVALSELLELVAPVRRDGARPSRTRGRGVLPLAGIALALACAAAAIVLLARGDDAPPGPRDPEEIERCNGFAALCDRRLDEVAFPSVHNAMSSADRGFLMANNAKGIPEQLRAGIRGLLIDAHWGRRGDGGTVVTDLAAEGGKSETRQAAVEATSEEFVVAAERLIRRRALGAVEGGRPGVYWCHVFCELGATPGAGLLREVREFLDDHPDEVVVLFVEDYVPPAAIETAARKSGLIDYVYTLRAGAPLPTLRQMIASGRRVIVMAENQGGGAEIPWYVDGFDHVQETPYTFGSTAALAAGESCAENRGEPGNALFQLNHWVERVPRSPKTAATANSFDLLLRRAQRCGRERERLANLVAVDFWEEGDLLEVTRVLNGLARDAVPEYAENG